VAALQLERHADFREQHRAQVGAQATAQRTAASKEMCVHAAVT